jgi:hypothetical protein
VEIRGQVSVGFEATALIRSLLDDRGAQEMGGFSQKPMRG